MIYKMELSDSFDTMIFPLLEVPIEDKDVSGIASNTTIDGNVFNDYLWLKKQYVQKWSIMCQDEYNRLRGFWTRQFGNAEVPFYRLFYGENRYEDRNTFTVNGFVQIENDAPLYSPLFLTQLLGNATQKTLSGKNLLPPPEDFTQTINGVSIKCENGVYTFSGTATANGSTGFKTTIEQYTIQSGDYWHYDNTLVSSQVNVAMRFTDDTNGAFSMNVQNRIEPLTNYVGKTIKAIHVNFSGGNTFNGTASPMILHNVSTQVDFEPYCGGVPSPNPDYPQDVNVVTGAQTVKITGKNLLDTSNPGDQTAAGMTATWNNGVVEVKGTNTATSFHLSSNIALPTQIKAGTEISVSFAGASVGNTFFRFYNQATSQYESLSVVNPNTSGTYTLTRDADAVQLYKGGVPTNTYKEFSISNWQIELGNQVSAYEPYQSQSQIINLGSHELAKIGTYQDYIWNDDGTWYIRRAIGKFIFDGTPMSGNISKDNNQSNTESGLFYCGQLTNADGTTAQYGDKTISDHLIAANVYNGSTHTENGYYIGQTNKTLAIRIRGDVIGASMTISDMTTWFSTHPTTFYYVLATPTDTEITDSELIEQLNHIYSLYQGQNNLWLIPSAGAQGEIGAKYRLNYEQETDIVPKTPVVLTLTDGGVINACGCRQNIQLIMRETKESTES